MEMAVYNSQMPWHCSIFLVESIYVYSALTIMVIESIHTYILYSIHNYYLYYSHVWCIIIPRVFHADAIAVPSFYTCTVVLGLLVV